MRGPLDEVTAIDWFDGDAVLAELIMLALPGAQVAPVNQIRCSDTGEFRR